MTTVRLCPNSSMLSSPNIYVAGFMPLVRVFPDIVRLDGS